MLFLQVFFLMRQTGDITKAYLLCNSDIYSLSGIIILLKTQQIPCPDQPDLHDERGRGIYRMLRKFTKTRTIFRTDDAVKKAVYLSVKEIS